MDWNLSKICQDLIPVRLTGTPENNRWDKFWTNLGFGAFLNAVRGKRARRFLRGFCNPEILGKEVEEERRCNTRGGNVSESLSEENCPLEALRAFFFSRNSHRKTSERSS